MKPMKPEDLFRVEKERAQSDRNSQHARLLAEAKAAFDKLMAEGQAARKSGRPRKHPLPPLKTSSSRPTPAKPMVVATVPTPAPKPAAAAPAAVSPKKAPAKKAAPAKAKAKSKPKAKS